MFKRLVIITAAICCLLSVVSCDSQAVKETPFKVGDVYYQSLQAACDAAIQAMSTSSTDSGFIVKIVKDASGPGISISTKSSSSLPTSLMIDFGSNSYTVTGTKADSKADFDISGVLLALLGDEGKLTGSGAALFSLADNSFLTISDSLKIEAAAGSYFAVAGKECDIYIDSYFDGSVKGNIKLDDGDLFIYAKEGSIDIGKLELAGSGSQLVFGAVRKTDNTEIDEITIDSQAEAGIPITTSKVFKSEEYDEIDKVLEKSGEKVHRHAFSDTPDGVYLEATCRFNRYDSFKCTDPDCDYVDTHEIAGTKDYTKHKLVHVSAVAPTATTSGIEECEECEWCHSYFAPIKGVENMTLINPILLATDNVTYADMQAGGIESLNATVQALEDELGGTIETKGKVSTVSNVLSAIFTACSSTKKLIESPVSYDEEFREVLNGLNELNGKMEEISSELVKISEKLDKNTYYSYYNERLKEVNKLFFMTSPYFDEIAKALNGNGSDTEKMETLKKKTSAWANQPGENVINLTGEYLMNVATTVAVDKNIFEVYDYIGRVSMCWEKDSRYCRIAMRGYDELMMFKSYIMAGWYYTYCCSEEETSKLQQLTIAWNSYRNTYNNSKMETSDQPTCWLYVDSGTFIGNSFNSTLQKVDYEGELRNNSSLYKLSYNHESITTRSIDKLIKNVDGNCSSIKFFDCLNTWYNKDHGDDANIYKILELGEFEKVDGTKISECCENKKYILTDPGKDFSKTRSDKWYVTEYRTICFTGYPNAQFWPDCWIAVAALGKDTIIGIPKIFTNTGFGVEGMIYKIGEPTGNQFYKLVIENYDSEPFEPE